MSVNIINSFDSNYDYQKRYNDIFEIIKNILKKENNYEMSVSFVDDKKIQEINRDYRNLDEVTDVISFAIMDDDLIIHDLEDNFDLGDIFISVDTARKQAENLNQSLDKELEFLFVHGVLHLFGYDHMVLEDEEKMFSLQRKIINEITEKLN